MIKLLPSLKLYPQKLPVFYILILCFFSISNLSAQESLTSDELFIIARTAAFEEEDYPKAIKLTQQALEISPEYADIRIFLGRLYTWTDEIALARKEFDRVLSTDSGYEDAHLAYGYLEYWNDNSEKALEVIAPGVEKNPESKALLMLKAEILNDLERFAEANKTLETLLAFHPNYSEARAFSQKIKDLSSKNQIGVAYDFVRFDKRFDDPWHLASMSYGRQTSIGTITGRLNYANRFTNNGVQFEVDAYPTISETFYAYVSGGISENGGIFPRYRAGFSLYANLPKAFEADAGFRFLSFNSSTWIYTASIGKYYSNYWFNLRTYLTPSNNSLSKSISFNVRYYLAGADDYLSFGIGSGLSPDRPENNILFNENNSDENSNPYNLKSNNVFVGYRKSIRETNVFSMEIGIENQEYAQDSKGYQFSIGVGYNKRF